MPPLTSAYSDLERAVEELSELIEAPIDPETIMTLRQKVTDKTVSSRPLKLRFDADGA